MEAPQDNTQRTERARERHAGDYKPLVGSLADAGQTRDMARTARSNQERWRDEFEGRGVEPPEAEDPAHLRLMPVFVLYGYALENLVKGLLVARGKDATWSGKLNKDLRHPCLTELFRVAEVRTTSDDQQLLDDLPRYNRIGEVSCRYRTAEPGAEAWRQSGGGY